MKRSLSDIEKELKDLKKKKKDLLDEQKQRRIEDILEQVKNGDRKYAIFRNIDHVITENVIEQDTNGERNYAIFRYNDREIKVDGIIANPAYIEIPIDSEWHGGYKGRFDEDAVLESFDVRDDSTLGSDTFDLTILHDNGEEYKSIPIPKSEINDLVSYSELKNMVKNRKFEYDTDDIPKGYGDHHAPGSVSVPGAILLGVLFISREST